MAHAEPMRESKMSSQPHVAGLYVHPIKSTTPIPVDELVLDQRGAVGDRRWMVVDGDGVAITARDVSTLALVRARFAAPPDGTVRNVDGALWVSSTGVQDLFIDLPAEAAPQSVRVWDDTVLATDAGDESADWFSEVLSQSCRLVRLNEQSRRPLAARFAGPLPHNGRHVALSDGAPLLVLGQASIDALNVRLRADGQDAVDVRRFRPNILLHGTASHDEDTWSSIRIGDVEIGVGSPCKRCVFTTVNPDTGKRGAEPLRTLATYRRADGHVMFAMNATHAAPGTVVRGNRVHVMALRS